MAEQESRVAELLLILTSQVPPLAPYNGNAKPLISQEDAPNGYQSHHSGSKFDSESMP